MRLNLRIRLQVPSARIDRTSEQEQVIVRRHHDRIVKVDPEADPPGVVEVERDFVECWEGVRLPGAQTLEREASPLHERKITVGVDGEGEREVRVPKGAEVPAEVLDEELYTERFEALLPEEPVAVGATWTVVGDRLRRALPMVKEETDGQVRCTLRELREEAIDETSPPDRYAIVTLELSAKGKQGDEDDDPTLAIELKGELRFSLKRGKIASVDVVGTGHLQQTRRDGETVATVDGKGPLEIHKRMWFPSAEEEAKQAKQAKPGQRPPRAQ